MTCEKFMNQYQLFLDGHPTGPMPPDLQAHAQICPVCSAFAEAIGEVDQNLRHMPDVEMPPGFMETLEKIPAHEAERVRVQSWNPDILRGAITLAAACAVLAIGSILTSDLHIIVRTAVLSICLILFAARALPRRLSSFSVSHTTRS